MCLDGVLYDIMKFYRPYKQVAIPYQKIDSPEVNANMKYKLKKDRAEALKEIEERYGSIKS